MDGQENSLNLRPLTDEDIDQLGLSLADVWMLKTPSGNSAGPYSTDMLQKDSKRRPAYYEECEVHNLITEQARPFYKVAEFQRRRPKLVPAQNLIKSDSFLVISRGAKTGPFSLEQLKRKIADNEVSLNQEVSVDEGKTWIKLYEHHAFDRRAKGAHQELPFQPSTEIFQQAEDQTSSKVLSLRSNKNDSEIINDLAGINREIPASDEKRPSVSAKSKIKASAAVILIAAAAGGAILQGPWSKQDSRLGEVPAHDSKIINNTGRNLKTKAPVKHARDRMPASEHAQRPKRYVAPAKTAESPKRSPKRAKDRESHSYEDFESLNMEDPQVREELARELAGDFENAQNGDYPEYDHEGNYPENEYDREQYPEPRDPSQSEAYEAQDPYTDEPEAYEQLPPEEEAPYEEYGDFE